MNYRRTFFKQSNLIEDVQSETAVDKNIEAYKYLRDTGEVHTESIKEVHRIIMENRQPDIAGKFKEQENFIPVSARHAKVFTKPEKVKEKMNELIQKQPETPIEALKWHVTFENIHPFLDGNGRVGRIIYYHQVKNEIGGEPIMFREEDKQGYYALMNTQNDHLVNTEVELKQIDRGGAIGTRSD